MIGRVLGIIYLVIGVFVAADHGYFKINDILDIVSAFLAIVLWPLPALGVSVKIGKVAKEIDKKTSAMALQYLGALFGRG